MNTIVLDPFNLTYDYLEQFILTNNGITHPSEMEFGKCYSLISKELSRIIRKLNSMDVGLLIVSHSTEKTIKQKNVEIDRIQPDICKTGLKPIHDFSDLILYLGFDEDDERKLYGNPKEDRITGCRGGINIENVSPSFCNIDDEIKKSTGKGYEEIKPTILLYGPPKIGKSSLAAQFPNPIIFDFENGYKFIDSPEIKHCNSWNQFLKFCSEL